MTQTQSPPLNILITGTSIAGPALTLFLLLHPLPATQKPRITLLERSSTPRQTGQNIDIRGAGLRLIRKLGLEKEIRAHLTGEEGVRHVDSWNRTWGEIPAPKGEEGEKYHAPTAEVEILRGSLARILMERVDVVNKQVQEAGGSGVEVVYGDCVESLEQEGDGVKVRFAKSGDERRVDLVVGADGLQSSMRRMVFGAEGETERLKKLRMYAAFFSMPRGSTDSDWRRWYHAPGRRGIMVRPHEEKDKTTVLMSVVNESDPELDAVAQKRGTEGVKAQKELMERYFRGSGWESERALKGMWETDDFYYDVVAQVKMEKWSKGRVVLLGDAGYCASPISGMGATLALTGSYHLAGALLQNPTDIEAAFSEYEAAMRPVVEVAQKLPPGMPHLLHPETWWGVWAFNAIGWAITASGLRGLLFRFLPAKAEKVQVKEYGLLEMDEEGRFKGVGL
ncbi:MAG: hypothetical protein Q9162_000282 [Coniocarpon cinnabarinum]